MTAPIDTVRCGRFEIPVLYMDNHLLAAVKPPNMLAQADSTGDRDMLSAMKGYVGRVFDKPGAVYLGLVHRLDRPVGGVMVFGRTSKASARLSADFSAHRVTKRYLAVVTGEMEGERVLEDWLIKDEATGMVRACEPEAPGGKLCRLITSPLKTRDGLTLCQVTLLTGRAHQIRVQHMLAGHALWGDARYGRGRPGEQIALWACSLTVTHPTLKTDMTLTASPPIDGIWRLFADETEAVT